MKTFQKVIGILNIVLGIGLLIILHFFDIPDIFSSIMLMSLFIGWIFPYIALVLCGIGILIHSNYLITMIFNIVNVLVIFFMLFLVIKLYETRLLIVLIEYIIMLVMSIISIIYLILDKDEIIKDNYKRNYLD